jgi:hypothetical protein
MKTIQPTYEMLPIEILSIEEYQRTMQPSRIKKIVKEFDGKRLGVLTVSFRNGKHSVIDGQHRLMALRVMNTEYAMCEVHRGLSYEEEAEMFFKQGDNRKNISVGERMRAQIEANDEYSMGLKKAIESCGFKVSYHSAKSRNALSALSTLVRIDKAYGRDILLRTLRLIIKTWDGVIEAGDARILMGVSMFVKEFENEFSDKEFIKFLSKVEPKVIIREGSSDISNNGFTRFKMVVLKYYNKNRQKKIG